MHCLVKSKLSLSVTTSACIAVKLPELVNTLDVCFYICLLTCCVCLNLGAEISSCSHKQTLFAYVTYHEVITHRHWTAQVTCVTCVIITKRWSHIPQLDSGSDMYRHFISSLWNQVLFSSPLSPKVTKHGPSSVWCCGLSWFSFGLWSHKPTEQSLLLSLVTSWCFVHLSAPQSIWQHQLIQRYRRMGSVNWALYGLLTSTGTNQETVIIRTNHMTPSAAHHPHRLSNIGGSSGSGSSVALNPLAEGSNSICLLSWWYVLFGV